MRTVAAIMFGAILTPLGIRLMLPYIELPEVVQPFEAFLIAYTDLLAIPFSAFRLPRELAGAQTMFGGLQERILIAVIGWSIVQAVVMTIVGFLGRRPQGEA